MAGDPHVLQNPGSLSARELGAVHIGPPLTPFAISPTPDGARELAQAGDRQAVPCMRVLQLYARVCMPAYARVRACMCVLYACVHVRACVRACVRVCVCGRAGGRACMDHADACAFPGASLRVCCYPRAPHVLAASVAPMQPATYAPRHARTQVLAAALCVLCAPAPGLCQETTFCKKNTW